VRLTDKLILHRRKLGFNAGDWVEVKSADEILATLDEQARLEALPFMPEMLQYCGKRFQVFKSAHKTCDTIKESKNRSMKASVHLEGLRCDGSAHGGCQAKCLLFWKEAWIKPIRQGPFTDDPAHSRSLISANSVSVTNRRELKTLARASIVGSDSGPQQDVQYSCQATELLRATSPVHWWHPQQYVKDLVLGNVRLRDFVRYLSIATFNSAMRSYGRFVTKFFSYSYTRKLIHVARARQVSESDMTEKQEAVAFKITEIFEETPVTSVVRTEPIVAESPRAFPQDVVRRVYAIGKKLNSYLHRYPYVAGLATSKTPAQTLDLQPGEWVQVRPIDEIKLTLNRERRNRGLKFDVEMVPYCGGTFRVLDRVEKIINERTGRMMHLPNECVILEGVTCSGCFSQDRLFCPRSIYPYWREIWLKRVESGHSAQPLTELISSGPQSGRCGRTILGETSSSL
jgi:hypothetical protein